MSSLTRGLVALGVLATVGCGGSEVVRDPPDGSAPIGSLQVRWKIRNAVDGTPLSCADLGADAVEVRIASEPRTASCSDDGVVFDRLLEGRYPVVVALKIGPVDIATGRANADVVRDTTGTIDVTIDADRRDFGLGAIVLRWRVDDLPAAEGCADIGGIRLTATAELGSIDETLMGEAACSAGELRIDDARPGSYQFRLRIFDGAGDLIVATVTARIDVLPREAVTAPVVQFATRMQSPGRLLATYTINGTVAADRCEAVSGGFVRLRVFSQDRTRPGSTRLEDTQTASCAAGQVSAERLSTNLYRLNLELVDVFSTVLTSTTVDMIPVNRGRTTTIAVDLDTRD
jgi:hypothetical protein